MSGTACSQASGARAWGLGAGKEEIKGRLRFMIAMDKCHSEDQPAASAAAKPTIQVKPPLPPRKLPTSGRLWQGWQGLSISAQSGTPLMGNLYAGASH